VDDTHIDVSALVLGDVDAQQRVRATSHLLVCPSCRAEYDEMAAALSELLSAVPAMQPPLGFDQQVLQRLGVGTGRRRRHQQVWLTAAAAVLIAVVGVGWWATTRDSAQSAGQLAALELVNGGSEVGTVSIGDVKGETVMVVALVDAPDGVSYRCRTTFTDGTVTESEPWPASYGAWIVPVPSDADHRITTVQLVVDGSDHVWSSASFNDD
jgi:anti-sigma factor RsiW